MQLSQHDRFLLFDFLAFISQKLGIKVEFLDLIREYEESRRGEY